MAKPLTEAEQADLVAFLDGELKGEAARLVETKVNLDPVWREEAAAHKRAWDMLDFLPKSEPTPVGPSRAWMWWSGGVGAAALGGWSACRAMMPVGPGERELVRDLRLIENKRVYERVDDFDFLEALAHPDLFGE